MKITSKNESIVLEALSELLKEGLMITMNPGDGWYGSTPEDLLEILKGNKEKVFCEALGISLQNYRGWQEHMKNDQCQAFTMAGKRCRNYPNQTYNPREFNKDVHIFCRIHGGKP